MSSRHRIAEHLCRWLATILYVWLLSQYQNCLPLPLITTQKKTMTTKWRIHPKSPTVAAKDYRKQTDNIKRPWADTHPISKGPGLTLDSVTSKQPDQIFTFQVFSYLCKIWAPGDKAPLSETPNYSQTVLHYFLFHFLAYHLNLRNLLRLTSRSLFPLHSPSFWRVDLQVSFCLGLMISSL